MVKDRHLKYAAGGLVLFAITQRGSGDDGNGGSDPDDDNGGSDPDDDNGGSDPDDGDDNGGGGDPDPEPNQPPENVWVSGQENDGVMEVWEDSAVDPDGTIVQWEWRLERTDTGGQPSVVDTSTGQQTTLDLAGTGSYQIVCIVTDNDGASAQDVWSFNYST